MKKVLILSSSPRRKGNSETLSREFMKGAHDAGNQTELILLYERKINYCTGCGTCYNAGKSCPQKDDMQEILDKMNAADVIVMSTPVYFYTMSAQMKTLIDRCCSEYTKLSNKEFYFITTAAETNKTTLERTVEGFRGFMDCLENATEKGVIYGTGVWQTGEAENSPWIKEAYHMGKSIL